jgi:hypothetical protein
MLSALVFNGAFYLSLSMMPASVVALSICLTVPLNFLADAIVWKDSFPPWCVVGSVLVFAGFVLFHMVEVRELLSSANEEVISVETEKEHSEHLLTGCVSEQSPISKL